MPDSIAPSICCTNDWQSIKITILNTPGISYHFGESETTRLHAALTISKVEEIGWSVQDLASIVVHSMHEDRYGVIQMNLQEIFSALLQLRKTITKYRRLGYWARAQQPRHTSERAQRKRTARLSYGMQSNAITHLCITFEEYLADLISDPYDLRILKNYIEFLEV